MMGPIMNIPIYCSHHGLQGASPSEIGNIYAVRIMHSVNSKVLPSLNFRPEIGPIFSRLETKISEIYRKFPVFPF